MFAGSGGALKFTVTTPNERTEEELMSDLHLVCDRSAEYEEYPLDAEATSGANDSDSALAAAGSVTNAPSRVEWGNLVLIVHQPPHDTKLDKITAGIHVGSPAFRRFIEEYQPLAAVSGHIHESASIDTIGKTTLINPGSLAAGQYAVLTVQKHNAEWSVIKAELKEL